MNENEDLYKPIYMTIDEMEKNIELLPRVKPPSQKMYRYLIDCYKRSIKIKQDEIKNLKERIKHLEMFLTQNE